MRDAARAGAERAVHYLEGKRRRDGLWEGFPTLAGSSSVWVSGFVAAHLRSMTSPAIDLTFTLSALRAARRPEGGWGYGGPVPVDADSTAWCMLAIADGATIGFHLGTTTAATTTTATNPTTTPVVAAATTTDTLLAEARGVLARHRVGNGYATYRADSGIADFIGARSPDVVRGWTAAHPDVSAAVVMALTTSGAGPVGTLSDSRGGDPGHPDGDPDDEAVLVDLVGAQQEAVGLVPSYWWRGPYYGTALLLRCLAARRRRLGPYREELMYDGLARMALAGGGFGLGAAAVPDAFSTALGLEALCRLGDLDQLDAARSLRDAAVRVLLANQREDGSWPGDYILRIPAPDVTDPRLVPRWSRDTGGGNSYVPDVDGLFATVSAAYALDCWLAEPSRAADDFAEVPSLAVDGGGNDGDGDQADKVIVYAGGT